MNIIYENEPGGQLSFLPIDKNTNNFVVQSNNLIKGRQDLTLNEAKLLRIVIMQIAAQDAEFKPYKISLADFAELIGNEDCSNMYKRAKSFTDSLQTKKVQIRSEDGSWISIVWVPTCKYNAKTKCMEIRLNDDLKPYLINLIETGFYTQYALDNIRSLRSVYALRIYELLMEQIKQHVLPKAGVTRDLYIQDIRDACMLYKQDAKGNYTSEPKYIRVSQLKEKVIDIACREITENTPYVVSYKDIKEGRQVAGFRFYINMCYHRVGG